MVQIDSSVEVETRRFRWVSGWVWFMSLLNLLLIITLGFVLWKVVPGVAQMRTAIQERDQSFLERDQALLQRNQAVIEKEHADNERKRTLDKRDVGVVAAETERDQAILQRNQAIIERDQAFKERAQAFDKRFTEMQKRFDEASRTLNALDSQLTLAQENQKKLGVLMQAQTDAFHGAVNKLEELINGRVQ